MIPVVYRYRYSSKRIRNGRGKPLLIGSGARKGRLEFPTNLLRCRPFGGGLVSLGDRNVRSD